MEDGFLFGRSKDRLDTFPFSHHVCWHFDVPFGVHLESFGMPAVGHESHASTVSLIGISEFSFDTFLQSSSPPSHVSVVWKFRFFACLHGLHSFGIGPSSMGQPGLVAVGSPPVPPSLSFHTSTFDLRMLLQGVGRRTHLCGPCTGECKHVQRAPIIRRHPTAHWLVQRTPPPLNPSSG